MIFLGVGSSIGKAQALFLSAEKYLEEAGIKVIKKSKIYKNPPLGGVAQNEFSNAVWQIQLPNDFEKNEIENAKKLLKICKKGEAKHGRDFKNEKWSDRTLDLDILMLNQLVLNDEDLKIPHPEIKKRDFVLLPWSELVFDDFEIPIHGNLHNLLKLVIRR